MIAKSFVFVVLIQLSFEADWECPVGPQQPQLGTPFLDGYWYELFSIKDFLNEDPCSHFRITCNDNLSCEIVLAKWDSYLLDQIYNGTILQKEDKVALTISENSTYTKYADINIQFAENSVLIWKCNKTDKADLFASLLRRMETQENMEAVWQDIEHDNKFLSVMQSFPAGLWKKNNATMCGNAAKTPETFINPFLVASLIVTSIFISM